MNLLYTLNYAIFSAFITLFLIEVGFALSLLIDYNKYSGRIRPLINPIWEVTGTFGVFYLVNYEVTYPKLLVLIGGTYAIPLLIALIFILLRNAFLALGDYMRGDRYEQLFGTIYSLSTLIAALLVISVLTSGISGIGIGSIGITASAFTNSFNVLVIITMLLFALSIASTIIRYDGSGIVGPVASMCGFVIGFVSMYIYLPIFYHAIQANATVVIIAVVLIAASVVAQLTKLRYAWIVNIIAIVATINLFGALMYPFTLGTQNVTGFMASQQIAGPEILITVLGGAFVTVSLAALVYLNYVRKSSDQLTVEKPQAGQKGHGKEAS